MYRNVLCLLAAAVGCAQEPPADFLRGALENHRELQALRRRVEEAQALERQAGVRPAPALEVETATGRPLGTSGEEEYSAGLSYSVETGGKRGKRVEVARAAVALARAEYDSRAREIAYEIKTRFAAVAAERLRAEALDRILSGAREALRLTQARVEQGDAAPLERQLLAVDLSRLEAQRAAAAGRLEAARLELAALAGAAPPDAAGSIAPVPVTLADLKARALEIRPDLRMARLAEQQSAAEVGLAEAQGRPDVTLAARYALRNARFDQSGLDAAGRTVPLRDRDNMLSFGISVPLAGRSRNRGNIEAAGARAAAARLRREHLERTVPLEVEAAWRRWESAGRAAGLLGGDVLRQSGESLEIVRQAYAVGQLRMLDVLAEQRRVIDTEMAHIDALEEQARNRAGLERAAGGELQ